MEKIGTFRAGVPKSYVAAKNNEHFVQPMAAQVPQLTLEGAGQTATSTYVSTANAPLTTFFMGTQEQQDWYLYWTSFRDSSGGLQGAASKMDVIRAKMVPPSVLAVGGFPPPAAVYIDTSCEASVANLAMSNIERS